MRRRRGESQRLRLLGGLPVVTFRPRRTLPGFPLAAGACLFVACNDKPSAPMAPQARSQVVQASSVVTATPDPAPSAPAPAAEKKHAVLCAHQLGQAPKDAPKSPVSRAGQEGLLPEKIPMGRGAWTWINLWAAWCVPCREEMPRLRSWQAKLAGERTPLKVAFVSIDDDSRQLETFLGAQPETGTRATYWLRDGKERLAWLKEAGFDGDPELPAHVLLDPAGKMRCKQQGAIEDADFDEVVKIVRGLRGGAGAGERGEDEHGFGDAPAH